MPLPSDPQLLVAVNLSPRTGIDTNVSTLPTITVEFNQPINSNLVNTAAGLSQYVVLIQRDQLVAVPIPLTSGTVDSLGRTLSFQPAISLSPGALYQVTLKKELRSAQGRGMLQDRTWTFTVSLSELGQVQLLSPADATAYPLPPQLQWQGVSTTGIVVFRLQLDNSFLFGPPALYETTTTASGSTTNDSYLTNIGISLQDRTEYFWRVRAETTATTGEWSQVRSFFLGDAIQPSPDTQMLYDPSAFFRLVSFTPENGTPALTAHPQIIATFSKDIQPTTVNNSTVQFFYGPVDGNTAIPTVQDTNATLTVVGTQILITPSVPIQTNKRYTIILTTPLSGLSGGVFTETFTSYYTSYYKPIYGGIIGVRSRLGGFINSVSDDEIYFFLWRASLHVNELLATRVFRVRDRISLDELVVYDPPFKTYGQYQYAELYAAVHILESFYHDLLGEAGHRVALSVFEYEVQVNILQELRNRIYDLRKEMWWWGARYLREITLPRVGMKSQFWNPIREQNPLARDWSYHPRRRF